MNMDDNSIRVLTLNCWGLKYVSKHRKERIEAIADELADSNYDIIGLQELWMSADYQLVRSRIAARLPYSKVFYSGALGSGLAFFSRFPINAASIHRYSLNGSPADVLAGDWFVGKAAVSILMTHPLLGDVEVFNTHLYAKGGDEGPVHMRAHRLVNAWEFAKLIRTSAEMGRYVIATGDFNSVPETLPMAIIKEHASLVDAWEVSHESSVTGLNVSPADAIDIFGVTADSPLNYYSAFKPLESNARRQQGKRLDYILYREPLSKKAEYHIICKETNVVFTKKVPGREFSYSDHFGLEATLVVRKDSSEGTTQNPNVGQPTISCLSSETVAGMLQALTACYQASRSRSRFQLTIFATCICLLLLILAGSAWIPPWMNPFVMLMTIALAWLATTMLYIGFLFGNWELRALINIIEEIELMRHKHNRERGHSVSEGVI